MIALFHSQQNFRQWCKSLFVILILLLHCQLALASDDWITRINEGTEERSIATGFFITDTGYVLTAYHVIADYKNINVLVDKRRLMKAQVIKTNPELDLALLKISAITPFAYLSHSKGVPAGMDVVTIGYPQVAIQGLTPKITKGIVNSSTGLRDDKNSFQFSAEVQKGNSGGPLIGPGGTIVGLDLDTSTNDAQYTLPTPTAGLKYNFIVNSSANTGATLIITSPSAGNLAGVALCDDGNEDILGTSFTFAAAKALKGTRLEIMSDGVVWHITAFCLCDMADISSS